MSDVCVAQLVRVSYRQWKDPGSNPGTVDSVSFSTERFQILYLICNLKKRVNAHLYNLFKQSILYDNDFFHISNILFGKSNFLFSKVLFSNKKKDLIKNLV